ncbi:hypothetical protein L1987_86884 [Smallanthus sonchifolius]|uniref:Uncharacterized protein n=1 Tax=Smallanthus sonchifolius TaxID=185202 RepID=A0ACB8Y153_9ASTR|nr:hypothetical protein L1987_86884 [Smallanthus sonchifolius]
MPWVGLYVSVASFICIVAMGADVIHAIWNWKLWFPNRFFTLNASTITLIAIAMKLPVDLTTNICEATEIFPSPCVIKYSKLSSINFLVTMLANFLPSLGLMDDTELLINVVALGILVITIAVNIGIQYYTKVLFLLVDTLPIFMFSFICSISVALTVSTSRKKLEHRYRESQQLVSRYEMKMFSSKGLRTMCSEIEEYTMYVVQIEEDAKLSNRMLRNTLHSITQILNASEEKEPRNLMMLLEKSAGFNGVVEFDNHQVPPLYPETHNCWSLVVVTLTATAIALPNIANGHLKELLSSITKGLQIVKHVEECLNADGDIVKARKSAMRSSKKPSIDQSPHKFLLASSMYKVSKTILFHYDEQEIWPENEELFEWISTIIADVLYACFTKLPRVIKMNCHHHAIEKRGENIRKASQLLGKSKKILKVLKARQLPKIDLESMTYIDKWCVLPKSQLPNDSASSLGIQRETNNPQFVIACTPISSAFGVLCPLFVLSSGSDIEATIRGREYNWIGTSDYKWSLKIIFIVQSFGVVVGSIAPIFRCFTSIGHYNDSQKWSKSDLNVFRVEKYWIQRLQQWKHRHVCSHILGRYCKIVLHNIKSTFLHFCIALHISVLFSCKTICLVPRTFLILISHCSYFFTSYFRRFRRVANGSDRNVTSEIEEYTRYVVHIEEEMKLSKRILRNMLHSITQLLNACEEKEPHNLMKLLSKSTGFNGVVEFDNDQVPPLYPEKTNNCWSLVVVTLATIAISLPNIANDHFKMLLTGLWEGLQIVRHIEECLNADGDSVKARKAATHIWTEVEVYGTCTIRLFTNLPRAIKMKCHHHAIEKMGDNIRNAALLLGKCKKILKILKARRLPNIDLDSMAYIDKWSILPKDEDTSLGIQPGAGTFSPNAIRKMNLDIIKYIKHIVCSWSTKLNIIFEYPLSVTMVWETPNDAMPWVGLYVGVASLICTLAMAADTILAIWQWKLWFPNKILTLNASTITLISIAMKLPVDLNTNPDSCYIVVIAAKIVGVYFLVTMLANFLPSLGLMDDRELLTNTVALGILMLTVAVNIGIQIFTKSCLKMFQKIVNTPSSNASSEIKEYSMYVVQIEEDAKLTDRILRNTLCYITRFLKASEEKEPRNLMVLLEKSTGFNGVVEFENDQVQPLYEEEMHNCWSLVLVTLTSIAIALPNIAPRHVKLLLSGMREGLQIVTHIEECLDGDGDTLETRKATKGVWAEVEILKILKARQLPDMDLDSRFYIDK